jgi:membrane-bound lytic murein transglycosylase F
MNRFAIGICIYWLMIILWGCGPERVGTVDPEVEEPQVKRDLEAIQEDGVLKAITTYTPTSYFLYRGDPMGFEYELLERFAEDLGVELEMVIAEDLNDLFDQLNRGEGDLIAHGLTITRPRKAFVKFTHHHFVTHQTLVQRKPEGWRRMSGARVEKALISNALDLIGDTVHVRAHSSYYQRLQNLNEEVGGGIHVDTVSGKLSTSEIIQMVLDGKIEYTVADHNIASITQTYYQDLDISTPVSFSQRIAWAVRKNSPRLQQRLNQWIEAMKEKVDYYVIYNKYFKNRRAFRRRVKSPFFSKNSGQISRYDTLIQQHSDEMGWDWRLVSALVYQESRFDPLQRSWAGAQGLMQLMPGTARELRVSNTADPAQNLRGGTRYLARMHEKWESIPDSVQRIKFALASYNVGLGHVLDAQRLADKYGADPSQWDDNVEDYLLMLSQRKYYRDPVVKYGYARGREPYRYVRDIIRRYQHYCRFIPLHPNEKGESPPPPTDQIAQF